jgi:hypothetical protein
MRTASANSPLRWLWYVVIGVFSVIVVTIWAFYSPYKVGHEYDRWIKFTIYTVGVFGYLLKWGWRYRTSPRFWGLIVTFLLCHCAAFLFLLPLFVGWGIPSNLILALWAGSEIVGLATLLALAMREKF